MEIITFFLHLFFLSFFSYVSEYESEINTGKPTFEKFSNPK